MKNISTIIDDILKSSASFPDFSIKKPLNVKEDGTTRTSLKNMKSIYDANYGLLSAAMNFNKQKGAYFLECVFERGEEVVPYTFKGFSFGYGGEGPHGLVDAMKLYGINVEDIALGDKKTSEAGIIKLK